MDIPAPRGYDQNYAAAQAQGVIWSEQSVTITLQTLMARSYKTEGTWGAIDGLADLLNGNDRTD